ncbi:Na+/H+ antiporter [uncultured Modestobacter sp.]|uniref:Na+/H+ antiporter n=1 Tax=uncultured Modestobacter sp. TaxID=380048 RepID=UPI0026029223|nr:Na+/H+ antiporter [uncultured Modestobacter sp.]
MDALVLFGLLLLGVVVLTPVADRIGVPQPVLLTVYGLALGALPVVPAPDLPPDLILPLVLPPLLFATTQSTSLRELREAARPILGLAVALTVVTAAVVAVVGHALGLPWAVAIVLGGIVAPPDPVAATAVAKRLNLPPRLVTILEGEGLFNDATALVIYQLSVMAVVAGGVSVAEIGWGLATAVLGGTALGLAGGWLARKALGWLDDAATETTVTLSVPFAMYLLAEHVGASGVLAVLAAGLYLRTTATSEITSAGWVLGRQVWQYVEFAVSGLLFGFLGVELISVLGTTELFDDGQTLLVAAAVTGVLIGVRAAAMFLASGLAGRRARRADSATPYGWRESAVASWAGMRGVVTVATALALPATIDTGDAFPAREEVVLVSLLVVVVTLVLQGLTLAPLIRRLGVATDSDVPADVRRLHRVVTEAALDSIRGAEDVPDDVRAAVLRQYEARLGYRNDVESLVDGGSGAGRGPALRDLLARATEAEREAVLDARRRGEASPAAADDVLFDVEARAMRYGS